ncbi:hypothetical protein [Paenibacillus sp. OV219]|uniref:hypothetical protein n=1 Tax=Paenibacillus sp. OV219 TaxID=1884377 RepID=UPI0008CD9934|nr:hypothetical protein [Paenibacillus sp. OV219]SEM81836.1 hypothetical protein SAMN05518847_101882 [Paenibacillus sp. OV219]
MQWFRKQEDQDQDFVMFGEKRVDIPKLTVAKWKALFGKVETLPQLLLDVIASRQTSDFTATVLVGIQMAFDEIVELVAVLTELEPAWIEENVDHNELIQFISRTVQRNNLNEAAKKFLAPFGKLLQSKPVAGR